MVDAYVRVYDTVVTQLCVITNGGVGIYLATVADFYAVANIGKGANIAVFTDGSLWRDKGQRVNTGLAWFHGVIELQQACHALIGVLYANQGGFRFSFQFYILVDQYNA